MSSKRGAKSGGVKAPASSTPQPTNAWTKPLTATSKKATATPNAPPGMGPPNKANAAATSSNGGLTPPNQPNASAMLMMNRDKMLSLSAGLVGQKVTVKMTTGTVVEGVYHTFTPFQNIEEDRKNRYVLKEAKVIVRGNGSNDSSDDDALKDRGDGSTLSIPISKVLHLHATKVSLDYKNGGGNGVMDGITNGFATDVQISGNGSGGSNRDLVAAGSAWTSAGANSGRKPQALGTTGGLSQPVNSRAAALGGPGKATAASPAASNKGGDLSGSIGQWDQFKANEELFNVNATFDENIYTTQLDTSQIDARKIAEAERIAREIEGTATTNIHLKEERGQKIEMDFDEEDLYSGVLTEDMKQRHEAASKASSKSKTDGKFDSAKSSSAKKMNYAAALAKAETPGKPAAPGFTSTAPAPAASNDESADEKKEKATEESKGAPSPSKAPANAEAKANDTKITTETSSSDQKDSSATEPAKDKSKGNGTADKSNDDAPHSKSEEKDAAQKDESKDDTKTTEVKKTSKLNANAKTFTFNPSAKSFTPSFGGSAAPSSVHVPPQHLAPPMADPNMQMYAAHPMAHPYMAAAPMGQPGGMMPIMNPQFQAMRYPGHYGIDQHGMSHMPNQPHVMAPNNAIAPGPPNDNITALPAPSGGTENATQNKVNADGNATPSDSDELKAESGEDVDQQQQQSAAPPQQLYQQQSHQADQMQHQMHGGAPPPQQPQHHQQQMHMHYSLPPQAYFTAGGAMGMPPRPGTYPPQFVTGPPHQMPIQRTGAGPYGMYPAGMPPGGLPPNMQMRGPNGAPYYGGPNNPMMYMGQHGMVDDGGDPNYRGRGGGGRGGGRGGRGRGGGRHNTHGRGGRGGRGYNNNTHSNSNSPTPSGGNQSGRNTPQQTQVPNHGSEPVDLATAAMPPPSSSDASAGGPPITMEHEGGSGIGGNEGEK